MILTYLPRLICLCFATFFVVCAVVELAAVLSARAAMQFADSMTPRWAARFLFAVRMFPAALGGLIVIGLCVPSYLWLEPGVRQERVGTACVVAALLGAIICAASALRGIRAFAATRRFAHQCRLAGTSTHLEQDGVSPICLVTSHGAVLGITGVFRPWLVVSQVVVNTLSDKQLNVALRHEAAHLAFRDNLKRLLLLLSPTAIPFVRGRNILDSGWSRFTEWAADDWAVEGDSRRRLSLATALVRMARMSTAPRMAPLSMSLLESDRDLSARVERLLHGGNSRAPSNSIQRDANPRNIRPYILPGSGALLVAGLLAAMILRPATLHSVHWLLEKAIH